MIHLVCEPIGAGKTTYAIAFARKRMPSVFQKMNGLQNYLFPMVLRQIKHSEILFVKKLNIIILDFSFTIFMLLEIFVTNVYLVEMIKKVKRIR